MMTPEDRERMRANAQAAMDRVDAMNGKGGSPEYSSEERPFPDEILELLDELDMWRAAREDALDEMERAEDTRDAIMADLRKERARIKAVHDAIALHVHRRYPDPAMYLYDENVGPLIKEVLNAMEDRS